MTMKWMDVTQEANVFASCSSCPSDPGIVLLHVWVLQRNCERLKKVESSQICKIKSLICDIPCIRIDPQLQTFFMNIISKSLHSWRKCWGFGNQISLPPLYISQIKYHRNWILYCDICSSIVKHQVSNMSNSWWTNYT